MVNRPLYCWNQCESLDIPKSFIRIVPVFTCSVQNDPQSEHVDYEYQKVIDNMKTINF